MIFVISLSESPFTYEIPAFIKVFNSAEQLQFDITSYSVNVNISAKDNV